MAERTYHIGNSGPFYYDDADEQQPATETVDGIVYNNPSPDPVLQRAFRTSGQIKVETAPTPGENEVARLEDILAHIQFIIAGDVNAPDLSSYAGSYVGSILVLTQANANTNEFVLYAWDDANAGGADLPNYVVPGSSGFWTAVGGKYRIGNGNLKGNMAQVGDFALTGTMQISTLTASRVVLSDGSKNLTSSSFSLPASVAQGDIIYALTNSGLTVLNKNTSATRYLSNQGTSNAPSWNQVTLTDGVTGILPLANGGTAVNNATAGAGTFLRGDGTGFAVSTLTLPNTSTINQIVRSTSANVWNGDSALTFNGTEFIITNASSSPFIRIANAATRIIIGVANGATALSNISVTNDAIIRTETASLILSARNAAGHVKVSVGATDSQIAAFLNAGAVIIGNSTTVTAPIAGVGDLQVEDAMLVKGVGQFNGLLTAGVGLTATTGNVSITSGALVLGATTRIALSGAGTFDTLTTVSGATFDGAVIINELGANVDTRIEGDTDTNLFFVDASADSIGVGTATPGHKFDVLGSSSRFGGSGASHLLNIESYHTAGNNRPIISMRSAHGTVGSPTDNVTADTMGEIFGSGYAGSAFRTVVGMSFIINASGALSSTNCPSEIFFETCPEGSVTRAERLRITKEGALLLTEIAANPGSRGSSNQVQMYMKGDNLVFQFNDGGTPRYLHIALTGSGTTWTHSGVAP
jgi:hypothetical protein